MAVYAIFALLPFDPAALTCGQHCNKIVIEANRHRLGYDKSLWDQYWLFLHGIFAGRNYGTGAVAFNCPAPALGYSYNENKCVTQMLADTLPITLNLAIGALILWLIIGVGLGIIAARFKGRWPDTASTIFVLLGTSLPVFVRACSYLFGSQFGGTSSRSTCRGMSRYFLTHLDTCSTSFCPGLRWLFHSQLCIRDLPVLRFWKHWARITFAPLVQRDSLRRKCFVFILSVPHLPQSSRWQVWTSPV